MVSNDIFCCLFVLFLMKNLLFRSVFVQADGEQPSTSRSLDEDEPDDLSEPLSSTGTERPGP